MLWCWLSAFREKTIARKLKRKEALTRVTVC